MNKNKGNEAHKAEAKEQENSDQAWARNRLQNEIQYLLDQGKLKEARALKKQLAELIKVQRGKSK